MALQVTQPPQSTPDSIPEAGRDVVVKFSARDGTSDGFLKAKYVIRGDSPYVFAAPTNPANPKVVMGPVEPTIFDERTYKQPLTLTKVPQTPHVMDAFMDVEISETDAGGEPILVGGRPVPPRRHLVVWTVE